jgi:hypothetical protein
VYPYLLNNLIYYYSVVKLSCTIVVSASFTLSKETVRMKQDFLILSFKNVLRDEQRGKKYDQYFAL